MTSTPSTQIRGPRRRARPDGPRLQGRLPAQGQGVAPRPAPQRPDGHEKVPGALRGLRRDQGLGRARGLRCARALPGHGSRLRPAAPAERAAERGAGGGDVGRGLGRRRRVIGGGPGLVGGGCTPRRRGRRGVFGGGDAPAFRRRARRRQAAVRAHRERRRARARFVKVARRGGLGAAGVAPLATAVIGIAARVVLQNPRLLPFFVNIIRQVGAGLGGAPWHARGGASQTASGARAATSSGGRSTRSRRGSAAARRAGRSFKRIVVSASRLSSRLAPRCQWR